MSDRSPDQRRRVALATLLAIPFLLIGMLVHAEYGDIVLNRASEANDVNPVIFPHWFHRIRFQCRVCHTEIGFKMRAGSNPITMSAISKGEYCGACHNGRVAWDTENCVLCHSGQRGLETGVVGGHETGGPGVF